MSLKRLMDHLDQLQMDSWTDLDLLREILDAPDQAALCQDDVVLAEIARAGFHGEAALKPVSERGRRRIQAAFALSRRRAVARFSRCAVRDVASALGLVATRLADEPVEVFRVLLLDARHGFLASPEISRGSLSQSLVHPREVFRPAILAGAGAVIVAHNHPSGDPAPSAEDDAVTERLAAAGELLGIPLLDHLVIGDGAHWSYRERSPRFLKGAAPGESRGRIVASRP